MGDPYYVAQTIVYDNASEDDTREVVAREYPDVVLVAGAANMGFAGACNEAAAIAEGKFLAFLNPDAVVEPGWIGPLLDCVADDPTVGAAMSMIVWSDDPRRVLASGNSVHPSGIAFRRDFGEPAKPGPPCEVGAITGGAVLIRRELFRRMNGFEGSFFMYYEDTDLSLRLGLMGLRCMVAPHSRVRHDHVATVSARKLYYLERNRYLSLLSLTPHRLLGCMLPSMVYAELLSWVFSLRMGPALTRAKACAWIDVWRRRSWVLRRRTQIAQKCGSHSLRGAFTPRICLTYLGGASGRGVRVAEGVGDMLGRLSLALANLLKG